LPRADERDAELQSSQQRKADHIRINLEQDVTAHNVTGGFERYALPHAALPGIDLEAVGTTVEVLGKSLAIPIIVASMTGGTEDAGRINRALAAAAQETGVAIGVGSQRAAIEDPSLAWTYQVRDIAPDVLLFANLGAIQLNYGYGVDECQRAVDMVGADALILHLNALQEALQPEGNTRFSGLLARIEEVCRALAVPVVAKEVGWGISGEAARQLADAGVAAIDVAGAGGTSWSQVEMHRARSELGRQVAAAFVDWGMPTAACVVQVRKALPSMTLVASGGIRDGIQVAKAIALGAQACSIARPFLRASRISEEAVVQYIEVLGRQLRVAMFAAGVATVADLSRVTLRPTGRVAEGAASP
jgi:isopentenyl-diphosphate delta-isomerase